jgi:hypothetical protein
MSLIYINWHADLIALGRCMLHRATLRCPVASPRTGRHSSRRADYESGSVAIDGKFGAVVSFRPPDFLLFWILRFIIAEALNTATRRGTIGTSTPVFGFRPIRWPFLRTVNVPNDDNFTVSPLAMVSVISLKTRSTSSADFVRVNPTIVR